MCIITLLRDYSSGRLRSDALVRRYSEDGVWVSKISKISPCGTYMIVKNILKRQKCRSYILEDTPKKFREIRAFIGEISNLQRLPAR